MYRIGSEVVMPNGQCTVRWIVEHKASEGKFLLLRTSEYDVLLQLHSVELIYMGISRKLVLVK